MKQNKAHTLEILITPEGEITGEVKGVKGPSCSSLSAWLDSLGIVTLDLKTRDYRKPADQGVQISTGG